MKALTAEAGRWPLDDGRPGAGSGGSRAIGHWRGPCFAVGRVRVPMAASIGIVRPMQRGRPKTQPPSWSTLPSIVGASVPAEEQCNDQRSAAKVPIEKSWRLVCKWEEQETVGLVAADEAELQSQTGEKNDAKGAGS